MISKLRKWLGASWTVKKLSLAGRWREAVLLYHAQQSGMEAGYSLDTFMDKSLGFERINLKLVDKAKAAMNKFERVSRLMYRAGILSHEGLCKIIDQNEENRKMLAEIAVV